VTSATDFSAENHRSSSSHRRGILEFHTTILLKHIDHANSFLQDRLAAALTQSKVQRFSGEHSLPIPGRSYSHFATLRIRFNAGGVSPRRFFSILSAADRVNLAPAQIEGEPTAPRGKAAKGKGVQSAPFAFQAVRRRLSSFKNAGRSRRSSGSDRRGEGVSHETPLIALVEKSIVERALRKTDGRVGEAARLLASPTIRSAASFSKLLPAL